MIHGHFQRRFAQPLPYVWAVVSLPGIASEPQDVEFLVDTGAAMTVLHPRDALRLNIPRDRLSEPTQWPRRQATIGIGGQVVNYVAQAQLVFRRADDSSRTITRDILIARPGPHNLGLPSVLGWDLLRHFRVCADWRTGEVLLQE